MTTLNRDIVVGALCVAAIPAASFAQEEVAEQRMADPQINFRLKPGFRYVWGTGIGGGGDFTQLRTDVDISATTALTDDLDLTLGFGYEYNNYEFSGETRFGGIEPWENVHVLDMAAILTLRPSDDWAVFGGPLLEFAAEAGADFGDSWIAGGMGGVTYRFSDDLLLGGGIGIVSQLEDEARLFPVVIIEWNISDDLRLSSRTAATATGGNGLELIYDVAEGWELAGGVGYEFRRFRLDDDVEGPAPEGAGEHDALPLWARLSYQLNETVTLNLYGGALAEGEFKIRDVAGVDVGSAEYETAPMIGFSASFRF